MRGRDKIINAFDKVALTVIMFGLAFVTEKALDRLSRPKGQPDTANPDATSPSRRLMPESMDLRHSHPHRPPPGS